jgi:phosphoadenosine phosphosulfate reductase
MTLTLDSSQESVLDYRIRESLEIIEKARRKSGLIPLILNYSGGKDSSVLLDLVRKVTQNFLCFYTVSGIEFPEAITFAEESCRRANVKLLLSHPSDYKGGFFERLERFRYWPTIRKTWCSRDLKFRPQKRVLKNQLGTDKFFKLNGVRRFESTRRTKMHVQTPHKEFMLPDFNVSKDVMVFPILNWRDEDVLEYLRQESLTILPNPLYEKYGVSGCYWCPFYQKAIYIRILKQNPCLYDEFIKWEKLLGKPSASGFTYLRDLKTEVCG